MNDEQRQAIAEACGQRFADADGFVPWLEEVIEPILCDALARRAESAEAALAELRSEMASVHRCWDEDVEKLKATRDALAELLGHAPNVFGPVRDETLAVLALTDYLSAGRRARAEAAAVSPEETK